MNSICIKKDVITKNNLLKEQTIVHMSDIHFNINTNSKLFVKIEMVLNKIKPDYIMITGDLIDESSILKNKSQIEKLKTFIKNIAKIAKVIISLGNHDIIVDDDYKFFEELNKFTNVYVLNNENYHDKYLNITGFTLPSNYYYNIFRHESVQVLIEQLDKSYDLINENDNNDFNIALIHSPMQLTNKVIASKLQNYDLILSGHTHDGMVPNILKFLFPRNTGIISPYGKLFPKIARGKIEQRVNNKMQTIIISGGVTKLSLRSAKALCKLNFVYNIGLNQIVIKRKEG